MDRLVKVTLHRIDTQDNVNSEEITLYEYDKRGLTVKEIGATSLETEYEYDGNGNLIRKTDADGYITELSYDERDLVSAINYSDGQSAVFSYNANGELILMEDWNGDTSFEIDLLGRISSVNDHNGQTVSYTYDAAGNQTVISYPDSTAASYQYALLGR
jgi:YD repeat-containing protein